MSRGLNHPLHPTVVGSVIGSIGASAFVLVNKPIFDFWTEFAITAIWLIMLGVTIWTVFFIEREMPLITEPTHKQAIVYGVSVLLMFAGIAVGSAILRAHSHEEVVPALVVLMVGLHFIPFAESFKAHVFFNLGVVMAILGVLGLVLGVVFSPVWAPSIAVGAGLYMLFVIGTEPV